MYLLSLILFIPFAFSDFILDFTGEGKTQEGMTVVQFPHYQVREVLFLTVSRELDSDDSSLYIYRPYYRF